MFEKISGAVDVKVTNMEMAKEHKCFAISGPTWQDLPPFSFEKFPKAPQRGLPLIWKFNWYINKIF